MSNAIAEEMRAMGVLLHGLGANVVAIPEGIKGPTYPWKRWHTERQTVKDVNHLMWMGWNHIAPAAGVGIVNGINGFRSIDLDACVSAEVTLDRMLQALGLPHDYTWAEVSGSGTGGHVYFVCHDDIPAGALPSKKDEPGVYNGLSKDGTFHHLEVRWHSCQTVVAPSVHKDTGKRYQWRHGTPTTAPAVVNIASVIAAFDTLARRPDAESNVTPSKITMPLTEQDGITAEIRQRFDMVKYAQEKFGGQAQQESNGEIRILGHGGLIIHPGRHVWYTFRDEAGGDCFDLAGKYLFNGTWDRKNRHMFVAAKEEAARYVGVALQQRMPKTPPTGVAYPTTVQVGVSPITIEGPDTITLLNNYPSTDAGNAECLEHVYRDQLRYCHDRRKWLVWDSHRWVMDGDGEAGRAALAVVRMRRAAAALIEDADRARKALMWALGSEAEGKRAAMLGTARILPSFATNVELYDRDPMLAGLSNGVLDLKTGLQREARREDYITAQLGAVYDPTATCPRWLRFLDEVFAGDQELIGYIQRAVGYSLTGDTREQKLFLCFGHGANGKSVFLDIISRLVGDYAANASFDTFDAGRRNEATNDLAALKGKRLVTVIESDDDRRLAEARVKAVTGQDIITCRFLYGELFSYRPQFKIWMAMNHKPAISGTDNGIWRRIQLIPFTQTFEGREDRMLVPKLIAELPGILNWALVGLADWQHAGLGAAAAIEEATREYRRESDLVAQWFDECTQRGDADARLMTGSAIDSYKAWCQRNGYRTPTARVLGRRLVELGFEARKGTGGRRYYAGLTLREAETSESGISGIETPPTAKSLNTMSHDRVPTKGANDATDATVTDESGLDHDRRREQEVDAALKVGNTTAARRSAELIRGARIRSYVEQMITEYERVQRAKQAGVGA